LVFRVQTWRDKILGRFLNEKAKELTVDRSQLAENCKTIEVSD
jgi:hypothetical protein